MVLGEKHLRRILKSYFDYYLGSKTHLSLAKDASTTRVVQGPEAGQIVEIPRWVACTIATNGALRNRGQPGPAVPLPRKLQPASRKAGVCPLKGSTRWMTSRTRDRGPERRAETAVFGRLFTQRVHQYHVLAKDRETPLARRPAPRIPPASDTPARCAGAPGYNPSATPRFCLQISDSIH
jgi:hypothetical protein